MELDSTKKLFMTKHFNIYTIKARLFPALLCSIPFIVIWHYTGNPYFPSDLKRVIFSISVGEITLTIILTYVLSQVNRQISKILFEQKSQFPTTLMLLPSSNEISAEFRKKISEKLNTDFRIALPTLEDEQKDMTSTKNRIGEITALIIHKVGSGTLLLQHNIEYGFIRNLIGGSVLAFIASLVGTLIFCFILKNPMLTLIMCFLAVAYILPIVFSKLLLNKYSKDYASILFREYIGGTHERNT